MKRIIIVLFVIFCFITKTGITQEKPFLFGMRLAPNIGWMKPNSSGYNNEGMKAGFSWGLITEIRLMENYDLHSGLNITMMRSALTYPDLKLVAGNMVEGELYRLYNLKYLGVPIIFRMKTNEFSHKRFFGQVGVELNFLLTANAKDKFNSEERGQINEDSNIYDVMKFSRYSVIVGAGMEYSVGGSNILITGVNFNNGISDVLKNQNMVYPSINQIAINNFIELYVSFLF